MSKAFREKYHGKKYKRQDVRDFTALVSDVDPETGKPPYITEQGHKRECDVNYILQKYDKTGLISHVQKFDAMYADCTGLEFKEALEKMQKVSGDFLQIPSNIRREFDNDPYKFLSFLDDPRNRPRAIELGLIRNDAHNSTQKSPSDGPRMTQEVKKD